MCTPRSASVVVKLISGIATHVPAVLDLVTAGPLLTLVPQSDKNTDVNYSDGNIYDHNLDASKYRNGDANLAG